jgi:hypothetical protein
MVQAYWPLSQGSAGRDEKGDLALEERSLQHDHCGHHCDFVFWFLSLFYGFDIFLGDKTNRVNILIG